MLRPPAFQADEPLLHRVDAEEEALECIGTNRSRRPFWSENDQGLDGLTVDLGYYFTERLDVGRAVREASAGSADGLDAELT